MEAPSRFIAGHMAANAAFRRWHEAIVLYGQHSDRRAAWLWRASLAMTLAGLCVSLSWGATAMLLLASATAFVIASMEARRMDAYAAQVEEARVLTENILEALR